MHNRTLFLSLWGVLALSFWLYPGDHALAASANSIELGAKAVQASMAQLGASKNDEGLLLLTNALYGQLDGQGAERMRDRLAEITGCTSGKRSLLDVHTPVSERLWFALFQKKSHKMVFARWGEGAFQSQTIEAAPDKLLEIEAWRRAGEGLIGPKNLFQVASIALAWAAGTDWSNLKAAGFHGELPPGINIGFLFHAYLQSHMPVEKGDQWLFFGALPKCYMDSLQVLYNTTLGKMEAYGVLMPKEQLSKYSAKGAMPCIVALQVNRAKDTCRGMVLGFSRKQVMDHLGVRESDLNPQGGDSNPVFCIARIKGSMQMAKTPPADQMKWIVEMKQFAGKAALAQRVCNAGADPYAIVWGK